MNVTTLEPTKQDVDNPTIMVHVSTDDTCSLALCGAKLLGLDFGPASRGVVECHVCADLFWGGR